MKKPSAKRDILVLRKKLASCIYQYRSAHFLLQHGVSHRFSDGLSQKAKSGFTLIELLVSITVFVIFLGMASQSYVGIVRAQRHANEVRKMYSDVRGVMDFLSEEIRLSAVDYECYGSGLQGAEPGVPDEAFINTNIDCPEFAVNGSLAQGKTKSLALVRKGGAEKTIFLLVSDPENPERQILKVRKRVRLNGVWQDAAGFGANSGVDGAAATLLSDRVEIENLSFAIFPDVNPYSDDFKIYSDNANQFQPKVTIFLSVKNAETVSVPFHVDFQTTVSSRVYSRKI